MRGMFGNKGGFFVMVLSVLGIVLFVTMFSSILSAFDSLVALSSASSYIAFDTVVKIAPTIIFLGGIFGAGFGYYKGYGSASASGTSGLLMLVFGALQVILFVTMFSTIMTAMDAIRTATNVANDTYIAMETVTQIAPTILFLAGIFAGGFTAFSGYKKWRKGRRGALSM